MCTRPCCPGAAKRHGWWQGWNLISQDAMEVMSVCAEHGVAVHLAGIFGGGQYPLFAPKPQHVEKVQQWEDLAAKHGVSLAAVAITFGSLPTAVDKVIMGVRSQEELEMNIEAMAEKVSRTNIAGIWVAFFSRCQRYSCGQVKSMASLSSLQMK